ncbi:bifunctional tetrahydrofolate synthase/dihydrofolate synthase [Candidatus Vondammii sp. HM_W22]|uniref:bifunctional tetrahydrofolate synthase/dihydrofolate synthase n=1 Tax=Candidatus Vondammii sp. HM_W22 TaxID=2687299 RepID=UPI001F1303FC|nr:bifunctional tetrahydrofolate synthase/dihydrofolate synthase [Candidatus Vondammii sp. HM_W22]
MGSKSLQEWLDWQSGLHPREIELGLERIKTVWKRLHPGPLSCNIITVAGTNGKGSCVAFLDAMLRAGGYRTGCYTSPHLIRYNERIRIDGEEATDDRLCQAFERIDQARENSTLTYFEFGTLAALEIFARDELDVAILEVGLGGRLDAVNIIDPDVALITTVDIDHTDWLGDTRDQIGLEKAGIMRPGCPVVFGGSQVPDSVVLHAGDVAATLFVPGSDFSYQTDGQSWHWQGREHHRYSLPMPYLRGRFQLQNASAVLMALECLDQQLPLSQQAIRTGLQSVLLPGRFQVIGQAPMTILDVAHNPEAARALANNLKDMFCSGSTRAIFSMLADKDVEQVARIIAPFVDHWYITELKGERVASCEMLSQSIEAAGVPAGEITRYVTLTAALAAAKSEAEESDRLLVFGSFYMVGEVLQFL